jgi:CRISPR type III-A-associated RAMP protein Csm5
LQENGVKLDSITVDNEIPILTTNYETHKNSQLKLAMSQNNKLYFPGSELKGAIKTTIFYNYLKENRHLIKIWEEIISRSENSKDYLKAWKEEIEREFEQFYKDQKSDYNLLRIEDTASFENIEKGVWEAGRFHLYKNNEEMVTWLCEGIKPDIFFELKVTVLPEFKVDFLQFLNNKDLTSLFIIINNFSKAQIELEIKEISDSNLLSEKKRKLLEQYNELIQHTNNERQALLRIGAGKTFFYNTVCSLLDRTFFDKLRSIVRIGKLDEPVFPLSRTFTADYECFGWILLELPLKKKIELPNNLVAEIILNKTILQVKLIESKKVGFILNGTYLEVQLTLAKDQKDLILKNGELIEVYVKQLSNDGRIVMTGIKNK